MATGRQPTLPTEIGLPGGRHFDHCAYVNETVHGAETLTDYDDYFGVTRSPDMTIDDYRTQALEKLATFHSNFSLEPREREALIRGDAVVPAVVSEALEAARGGTP